MVARWLACGEEGLERALLAGVIIRGGGPNMAPLDWAGSRKASSSAGPGVGSFCVPSSEVSADKNLKDKPAHSAVYALPSLMNSTGVETEASQVSDSPTVEGLATTWHTRTCNSDCIRRSSRSSSSLLT